MVDIEKRPRLKIVSGLPHQVESELNRLLDDYAVTVWNFTSTTNGVVVSAVLVHQSELRKMQIAAASMMMPGARH